MGKLLNPFEIKCKKYLHKWKSMSIFAKKWGDERNTASSTQ